MSAVVETRIARRYAQALFAIAEEKSAVVQYLQEWQDVVSAIYDNEELARIFLSRLYDLETKKSLADKLFKAQVGADVFNFLQLILDKGREEYLADILANFQNLADEKQGVCAVRVISAAPMAASQEEAIGNLIRKKTCMDVRISKEENPELLGGFKVIIGDMHYDASLAGQLSALKQQLVR